MIGPSLFSMVKAHPGLWSTYSSFSPPPPGLCFIRADPGPKAAVPSTQVLSRTVRHDCVYCDVFAFPFRSANYRGIVDRAAVLRPTGVVPWPIDQGFSLRVTPRGAVHLGQAIRLRPRLTIVSRPSYSINARDRRNLFVFSPIGVRFSLFAGECSPN